MDRQSFQDIVAHVLKYIEQNAQAYWAVSLIIVEIENKKRFHLERN
jgi:hypothetical protein